MYLKKAEYNKKYPKYIEISGGWEGANHALDIAEGRFFPTENGYVLLMSVNSITGFNKTDLFSAGCMMSLEIHRSKHTQSIWLKDGGAWTEKEIEPDPMEVRLCKWLDLSEAHANNLLSSSFSGMFNVNNSPAFVAMIDNNNGDCGMLLLNLKTFESNLIKEAPKSAETGNRGFSKGASYSEKQKAEQRLEFIADCVASYFGLKVGETLEPGAKGLVPLLSEMATSDYISFLTLWSTISLALGIPSAPPSDIGIPFRSTRIMDIERGVNEPKF